MPSFFQSLRLRKNEEKIPFANEASTKNSGATSQTPPISKSDESINDTIFQKDHFKLNDSKVEPTKAVTDDQEDKGPMSLRRKTSIFLSLIVWVLYIGAFFWVIPCNFKNCPGTLRWNINFDDIELTTNLFVVRDLSLFGFKNISIDYYSENEGGIGAINTTDGKVVWVKSLDFVPVRVNCGKWFPNQSPDCFISGTIKIVSFNLSNGEQIWEQNLESEGFVDRGRRDVFTCDTSLNSRSYRRDFRLGRSSSQYELLVLDVSEQNVGPKTFSLEENCKQLALKTEALFLNQDNQSDVVFLCLHTKSADLWAVPSRALCSHSTGENVTINEKFYHLYSIHKPILFSKEVVLTDVREYGFIIGYLNVVVLLAKGSHHHEIWKHLFAESSFVISIVAGHFTQANLYEIAVTVEDVHLQTVIYILSLSDGSELSSLYVGDEQVKSISLIPAVKNSEVIDYLLVETKTQNTSDTAANINQIWNTLQVMEKMDNGEDGENSLFRMFEFSESAYASNVLVASSVKGETVIIENGNSHLLLAEQKPGPAMSFRDYFLRTSSQKGCNT